MNKFILAIALKILKSYLSKDLLIRLKNELIAYPAKQAKQTATPLDDKAVQFLLESDIDDKAVEAIWKLLEVYIK